MNGHSRQVDVAKLAGVSVSTVSRVTSHHPDVSEETKHKVEAAMDALNYQPFAMAQSLVGGHSHTLGLLVSDIANPFYPQLASAIEVTANEKGYIVFLCNTNNDPVMSKQYIDRLLRHGVDGIIYASFTPGDDHLREIIDGEFPFVFVNRRPSNLSGINLIAFDSNGGAREAVRYLIKLGHKNIGFFSGPQFISTEIDRLSGFRTELEVNGLPFQAKFIRHMESSRQNGYQAAKEVLGLPNHPTALIANDIVAYGILDAATDLGLRVPDNLSVIGFGAIEGGNFDPIRLTTISSQIRDIGRISCLRLIEQINNPKQPPKEIILQSLLIQGDTTGIVPT